MTETDAAAVAGAVPDAPAGLLYPPDPQAALTRAMAAMAAPPTMVGVTALGMRDMTVSS